MYTKFGNAYAAPITSSKINTTIEINKKYETLDDISIEQIVCVNETDNELLEIAKIPKFMPRPL